MSDFDADRMMGWIGEIIARGPRRPGSPADLAVEADLADKLNEFGFESVRRESIPITVWHEGETSLEVVGAAGETLLRPDVQAIAYVKFTPRGGVEGPLLFVDSHRSSGGDWTGAVVVVEIGFPPLNTSLLLGIAMGSHDPEGTLKQVDHPATWVRLGWHLYREAAKRGAIGFVGILKDQPGGTCRMFGPYGFREENILDKPLPGVWIGRDDGEKLKRLAQAGGARARLEVLGTMSEGPTHNVVAELPGSGNDEEVIVLSCHHDSPFRSPVEDATGCSVVLALAERFAATRPLRRRLVVVFTAGHFYGSIGTRTFIKEHPEIVRRTALEISIEHVAHEAVEGPDGKLMASGKPEPTVMFVSFSRAIAGALVDASKQRGLDRVVLLPAEGPLGNYPPTDGGDWYEAGVPVINCISNPVYLLTDEDDLKWVDRERLPKVAEVFDQVIRRLDGETRQSLASTKSPGFKLAMKALNRLSTAVTTRLGTREFY